MRRPAAAVLGAITGITLLVGAKVGTHTPKDTGSQLAGDPLTGPETPASGPQATGDPLASASPGATGPAATAAPQPTGTAPGPKPTGTSTGPAPTSGPGLKSGTFAGSTITHQYGTLRVTITVSGGRITAIAESYTTHLTVSERINKDALPKLRQEALAAQSARIDTVSGATYTSGAYRSSLQAAIDRAKS